MLTSLFYVEGFSRNNRCILQIGVNVDFFQVQVQVQNKHDLQRWHLLNVFSAVTSGFMFFFSYGRLPSPDDLTNHSQCVDICIYRIILPRYIGSFNSFYKDHVMNQSRNHGSCHTHTIHVAYIYLHLAFMQVGLYYTYGIRFCYRFSHLGPLENQPHWLHVCLLKAFEMLKLVRGTKGVLLAKSEFLGQQLLVKFENTD